MNDIEIFEKHLDELKRRLMVEENFNGTFGYFFDHLGENPDFLKLGKRAKNPDLKKIVQVIGKSVLDKEVIVTKVLLKFLQKQRFYHGGCQINERAAILFFFREINMGMVAMLHSTIDFNMSFVRFTTFESPNKHLTLQSFAKPAFKH